MHTFVLEPNDILTQFQLHSDHTLVRHAHFPGIGMKLLLPKLTSRLRTHQYQASKLIVPRLKLEVPVERHTNITQAYFWPRVCKFFKKKDVIITETGARLAFMLEWPGLSTVIGSSSFGILDVPLPEQSVFVSQILYGSIGWTVGKGLEQTYLGSEVTLRSRREHPRSGPCRS